MGDLGDLLRKAGLKPAPAAAEPQVAPVAPAAPEAPPAPLPKKLRVRYERKGRGGKTVTVVSGLLDAEHWLKRLQGELGVGGRVEDGEVVLQGEQVERVARWFESQGVKTVQRG